MGDLDVRNKDDYPKLVAICSKPLPMQRKWFDPISNIHQDEYDTRGDAPTCILMPSVHAGAVSAI